MIKEVKSESAPAPIGPYSQAVLAGGFLFVSGQIALNPSTGVMDNADIKTETRRVMSNLEAILAQAGLTFAHIVKCTIFVKDLNDFSAVNEMYGSFFGSPAPARETVEVSRLPKDANVEISCIAAV